MARGQLAHPHGRTLGQIQSSTGDGQGRALMCTDSKTSRVVHHSHGCGIRGIALDHLDARAEGRGHQVLKDQAVGKTRKHTTAPRSLTFQCCFFL